MAILIYGFWLVLNGRLTGEIMFLGIPVMGIAMLFACKFCDWSLKKEWGLYRCIPLLIAYMAVVVLEIIKANLALTRVVYRKQPQPVVCTVQTKLKSRMARMLLANSITLTPGTITVDFRDDEMLVHCLDESLDAGLEGSQMEEKLMKLEGGD